MKLSLIVALDSKNGIGKSNELLCYLPNDLKYFKKVTMHKPIVMGYNTFMSIGKALPGRRNIVLTSKQDLVCENVEFVSNLNDALALCSTNDEVMIIGGASIYEQLLPKVDNLYITFVHHHFDADAFFPKIEWADWLTKSEVFSRADDKNLYDHTFSVFERKTC